MPEEPLKGFVFVFTGEMSMDREEAKGRVIVLGARVTTAVSSKTTHLVTGTEPGPSKLEKARSLEIKILSEEEFKDILDKYSFQMNQEISTNNIVKDDTTPVKMNEKRIKSTTNNNNINSAKSTTNNNNITMTVNDVIVKTEKSWAEKYRPLSTKEIIGNQSIFNQLKSFINGETQYKSALLSGSPGVGKTTTALAVCREMGITPIEFNASDLRSKKMLIEKVAGNIQTFSISKTHGVEKKVIIMDEVDGMSSDRGGIPELVAMIKKSKIPIICICNDKTHPKMRTLASYCLDLHFRKLDSRTILPRIKEILEKEGKKLPDGIINEIIFNSNGDMRYILNTVQNIVSKESVSAESVKNILQKKNVLKNTFEIASEIFQRRSVAEKMDLYFEDYSLVPLFVQENYLKCTFKNFKDVIISADSISMSDIIDARIHGTEQEWSLMPYHAFFSCVNPLNDKTLNRRLDFPLYLGQNSKLQKNSRILNEICHHMKNNVSRRSFRMYIGEVLYRKFMDHLSQNQIDACIDIIKETDLLKEDVINMGELLNIDLFKSVPAKTKTAFTREYNKIRRSLPYKISVEKDEVDEDE